MGNEAKTCTLHANDDGLGFENSPEPIWLLGDSQKSPQCQHIDSLKQRKINFARKKKEERQITSTLPNVTQLLECMLTSLSPSQNQVTLLLRPVQP